MLAELVRDRRKHGTLLLNTLVGSSASAGGIERANQEVAKQCRALRSRTEEAYAIQIGMGFQQVPKQVRHAAWLITHFQIKADGKDAVRTIAQPYIPRIGRRARRDGAPRRSCDKLHVRVWLGKSPIANSNMVVPRAVQHALDRPKCAAPSAVHVLKLLWHRRILLPRKQTSPLPGRRRPALRDVLQQVCRTRVAPLHTLPWTRVAPRDKQKCSCHRAQARCGAA